ncbi:MAG: LNR domain-containing protein [Candidatus Woesearchaeota archaeon]
MEKLDLIVAVKSLRKSLYNEDCDYDGGDCEEGIASQSDICAQGCPIAWLGDRQCDETCNNGACNYDNGDCASEVISKEEPITFEPIIPIESPTYAKAIGVTLKRIAPGIIGKEDGEVIFEISNNDPNHKLEGILGCEIPNDVIVTSTIGAAAGDLSKYLSERFTLDPAPSMKSITLRLSSQSEGNKYVKCDADYVLYKEGSGYLVPDGSYKSEKRYQRVTLNRDIIFSKEGSETKTQIQDTVSSNKSIIYIVVGIGLVVLLIVIFLAYKCGRLSEVLKEKQKKEEEKDSEESVEQN